MSDTVDTTHESQVESPTEGSKLAETETELAMEPPHGDNAAAKEEEKIESTGTENVCFSYACSDSHHPVKDDIDNGWVVVQTIAGQTTAVSSSTANIVTAATSNVGDSVFSMFGGGAKKERKGEEEDRGDVSGSAKAMKEAASEENPEVRLTPANVI
jgi:hypothetical protein